MNKFRFDDVLSKLDSRDLSIFVELRKPNMTTTFVANTVILTTIIVCIAIARDLMRK